MPGRALYIAAYDIRHNRRLRRALNVLKGYATGGQKSVFECFLTEVERQQLLDQVHEVVDESEDHFVLLRLEQRATFSALGVAVRPADPDFFYVG